MEWFRWHHGSVTDPKFQLVAKKAGASVAEVVAVWAFLLEEASQSDERGNPGDVDFDSIDCLLGLSDGMAMAIHDHMWQRGLLDEYGAIAAWDRRQPKREREDATSTDRVRAFRAKQRNETPGNAKERQETPRGEEIREEEKTTPAGFVSFWTAWPKSDRKQAKGKCLEAWKKAGAEPHAALIVAHVERLTHSDEWTRDGGRYVPAPLVYLNQRRWEGAEAGDADPYGLKGAL